MLGFFYTYATAELRWFVVAFDLAVVVVGEVADASCLFADFIVEVLLDFFKLIVAEYSWNCIYIF